MALKKQNFMKTIKLETLIPNSNIKSVRVPSYTENSTVMAIYF